MLKLIGAATTIAVAAATAYAAALLIESIPDIQRYLKIRAM
ncbi:DUF6893 family small protein [Paractinoplanes rishiriensis]|uniref:Uncharacterized protein n=1 Tax=Paractinoplanes rishiriensis TaxID=1050105 RepID=A0A919K5M4_9ACTN|nr:hypothetical protein [Actinoplanes rishiriensis]GIF00589.1 hypothetical protein Ari01nite_80530 [Actinoplanes rishiriensis]